MSRLITAENQSYKIFRVQTVKFSAKTDRFKKNLSIPLKNSVERFAPSSAHKVMRLIKHLTLACHGMKSGLIIQRF